VSKHGNAIEKLSQEKRQLEAENAKLRAALERVKAYLITDESPLYGLWENGDICAYDENPVEKWEEVLEELDNPSIDADIIGYGTQWAAVKLYREVLAALKIGAREEGEKQDG
jgi:ABC-type oligopeptide transport system substrate-binding subunit